MNEITNKKDERHQRREMRERKRYSFDLYWYQVRASADQLSNSYNRSHIYIGNQKLSDEVTIEAWWGSQLYKLGGEANYRGLVGKP